MNYAVKLFLVAVLALMLVPYSYANELLPLDIIRMLEAPALQPDLLATKDSTKNRTADNTTDIKKSGELGTSPVVQHQSLNEYLPPDIIRMLEAPPYQPAVLAIKDSPKDRTANNTTDIKKSGELGTSPVVQHQSLNEYLPPDIIRMLEAPAFQPDVLTTKDSPGNRTADNTTDIKRYQKIRRAADHSSGSTPISKRIVTTRHQTVSEP